MGGAGGGGPAEMKETAYQRALAAIAMAKWNDYKKRYVPFENKAFADISDKKNNLALQEQVAGQVNADMAQAKPVWNLQPGQKPGESAPEMMMNAVNVGTTSGKAVTAGRAGARDIRTKGLQAITDIGRGQATDAQLGATALAETSVKQAIGDSIGKYQEQTALGNMIGAGVGVGAYGLSKYLGQDQEKNPYS